MLRSPVLTKISSLAASLYLALFIGVTQTFAADPVSQIPDQVRPTGTITGSFSLRDFFTNGINSIVNIIFFLAAAAAIIYLVWAGIKYITSGGDTKKAGEARTAILNAVIGIAVIIGAYTLINIAFGINSAVTDVETGVQEFQ